MLHCSNTPSLRSSSTILRLHPAVEHFPQHQSMRRRRHASHTTVALRENMPDILRTDLSLPYLHQRSHDSAAHFVEEPVAFDDERQQWTAPLDVASRHCAHCGFH